MTIFDELNHQVRYTSPKISNKIAHKIKLSNKDQVKAILLSHDVSTHGRHHYVLTHSKFQSAFATEGEYKDNEAGGEEMDDTAKLLLERLERDSREREERYHKDAQEREQRHREQLLEQDRRFRQEAKEREERIMASLESLKTDLKEDFKDVKDESRSTRNTVLALTISVILGVAAMVVAVVIVV